MSERTPGDWFIRDHSDDEGCLYIEAPTDGVATVFTGIGEDDAQANAQFIVRACNSFDELLAACKLVASTADKTLLGSGTHEEGAAMAFGQCAEMVQRAIEKATA